MSIEALKEQARQHEQNENWAEALQVYIDAINRQSDNDQPDLGLYNRAGDLSTRIGDSVGAIQYYEQAVDLYLEAELPNNAIAILKKILRNLPERSEVFLRMGQIRAQQGFLTDARDNFLTYAERRQQEGDMDEAFRALEEFADVAPGDVEVRLALAEQLHAHERSPEALQQLAHAYHQYIGRGESEAAQGIANRIQEIDASFVIPAADELSGGLFETNVLGADAGFEADYEADDSADSAFDEIALDDDTEIDFASESEIELSDGAADEIEASDEISFESADDGALESDDVESPLAEVDSTSEEAEAPVMADSGFDDDDDDVFGFGDEETTLDFGTAVFGDEEAPAESGSFAEIDEAGNSLVEAASDESDNPVADGSGEALVDDQDDWEIGSDLEDAFISFDGPEDEAQALASEDSEDSGDSDVAEAIESIDTADEIEAASEFDTAGALEATDLEAEDDLPFVSFDDPDDAFDTEAATFEDGSSESVEATEEVAAAELSSDGSEFDIAPLPETETAVALEEQFEADEASEWQESEVAAAAEDDLWSELEEPEAEAASDDETLEDEDLEDEWIGEAVEEPESVPEPALADFEAFSITELREYVSEHESFGPAWERLGRVSLQEGDAVGSQQAFEEAHIAYAQSNDFMSAMRCVRELLLGEPDQMVYHQRLVEYANQGDDRTLLVSAYLELADCLDRTGAPAKARAVREKVIAIDPTNRRAAEAIGGTSHPELATAGPAAPQSDSGYVDLGSMVIDQSEKTTRWTVESEEPVGEADFDFQNMLAQFKSKVAENVDVGDVKAHYDLGTAYKEMGLVEEAITEFQAALRADGQNLATYEMLGRCFMDKGQPDVAIRSLMRATEMPFEVEDELLGIYYYLGRAHEELDHSSEAIEYYEKIFALDINFEDVTERLRALR